MQGNSDGLLISLVRKGFELIRVNYTGGYVYQQEHTVPRKAIKLISFAKINQLFYKYKLKGYYTID